MSNEREGIIMDKLSIKTFYAKYKLTIPEFQRGLVWNPSKKLELIDSLCKGFPIGAITLFETKDGYLIVDGLQRINTIYSYLNNPKTVKEFKLYYKEIEKLINDFSISNELLNVEKKMLKNAIEEWYSNLSTENDSFEYKFEDFYWLKKCLESNNVKICDDFKQFIDLRNILLKYIDINDQEMILITYRGDMDMLPELFSKINKKNVSLSSYEILHSMWKDFEFSDQELFLDYKNSFITLIENNTAFKYNNMDNIKFNMYMNLASVGYIINNENEQKFKEVFQMKNTKFIDKNEIIFDIFSTLFSHTTNKINKEVTSLFEKDNPDNFIYKLNSILIECSRELNIHLLKNEINYINSKYFYIYLYCYVFFNNYEIDKGNLILTKQSPGEKIIIDSFPDCREILEKKWFVGENRQLDFFVSKIGEIKKLK